MRLVTKQDKETEEYYEKYIWHHDESKDYTDFRTAEGMLLKLAEAAEKLFPEEFKMWLAMGQKKRDFADFLIHKLRVEGANILTTEAENAQANLGDDTACDPAAEGEDKEYTQEDADEEFQMLEDRDRE